MTDQENGESRDVVRLAIDNFTPVERTPWGGERIAALKGMPQQEGIGEAWELSVEPSFIARTAGGTPLPSVFAAAPEHWLGAAAAQGASLLVKLLDAREALSVQIHPPDDDPTLRPTESGKPEAWYVIDAAPGAGIYLGLDATASEARFRETLASGGDASKLLTRVSVARGDFFRIDAGTPHCVGPGVFLVEPQRVLPQRRGVTYRYWDWNRTYGGVPRALDVERALAVTRWDRPRGTALLDEVRVRAGAPHEDGGHFEWLLGGPPPSLRSSSLAVARVSGHGALELPDLDTLVALTVLEGTVRMGSVEASAGRTLAIAARAARRHVNLDHSHAIFSAAFP